MPREKIKTLTCPFHFSNVYGTSAFIKNSGTRFREKDE
jgi:hypothetical protein